MDVRQINTLLASGQINREDMWPRLAEMESKAAVFRFEFGLDTLPTEPGVIMVRGPRQYGKSTWLDLQIHDTVAEFGAGSAFYLNGDECFSTDEFARQLIDTNHLYPPKSPIKRLFIDEITSIPEWEKALKRVLDQGLLRDVLIVTTGSRARDLRRGAEKLPGRKGRLSRTEYVFLPVSYRQFHESCGKELGNNTLVAYLISGGSPIACNDIYQFERLPEYFIQLTRDWVMGDIVTTGRSRLYAHAVFQTLFRFGGSPLGFAKLAREAGLANNTVASGYIEALSDLFCCLPAWPWDPSKRMLQFRKPCKVHFMNLAAAVAFHPANLRHAHEFSALDPAQQGMFLEWLVAQELWRRSALAGRELPEDLGYWRSESNEIDFVCSRALDNALVEVKAGRAGPLNFTWFPKSFPKQRLNVICNTPFEAGPVKGLAWEDFLLGAPLET